MDLKENFRPVAAYLADTALQQKALKLFPGLTEDKAFTEIAAVSTRSGCLYSGDNEKRIVWFNDDSFQLRTTGTFTKLIKDNGVIVTEETSAAVNGKTVELVHYAVAPTNIRRTAANRLENDPTLLLVRIDLLSKKIVERRTVLNPDSLVDDPYWEQIRREAILALASRMFGEKSL